MEVEGGKVDDKKMSSRVADGKCGADWTNIQVFGHPRLSLAPRLSEYLMIRRVYHIRVVDKPCSHSLQWRLSKWPNAIIERFGERIISHTSLPRIGVSARLGL